MTSMQDNTAAADHVDLCIIGSGSGLSLIDDDINDWQIALIDNGIGPNDAFGGTCLNAGCIPSKMFSFPATYALAPTHAARVDVDLGVRGSTSRPSRPAPSAARTPSPRPDWPG